MGFVAIQFRASIAVSVSPFQPSFFSRFLARRRLRASAMKGRTGCSPLEL
jgi:hypothetical protein